MSRSRCCCHRSTARSLHHRLTPPLVERSLHLRRREPVHLELLLQHVLLRLQCHALVNPSCGCHPADRWSRPLDAPALLRPRSSLRTQPVIPASVSRGGEPLGCSPIYHARCRTMSGDAHPTSGCRAWTNQVHLTRFPRAPPVVRHEMLGPMADRSTPT